jgi:serine/threonine protein kinase
MKSMEAGGVALAEPLTSEDPREVAGYQIRARLGAGGMGRVYLAFTRGGRAVAIKVVRAEFGEEEEFRDRFRQEVVAAQRVHGMYAAQVLDADPDAPQPWLATAYVPGLSLQQAVTDYGPLPADTVFLLVAGIAEALQAIHAAGIVHRDLKPSNVILAADGPRVIDFGVARSVAAPALTRGGALVGSPPFMAPEQARGHPVTSAVDVFALGSLAAFAITGRLPFGAGSPVAVLYRVLNETPDLRGCPPDLQPLIERCLAKDPAQRPQPAEIIDTCQARMVDGALAFDGSWLPAAVSVVAAAPLASLAPGKGSEPDDATSTDPSFSGQYSSAGALVADTYSGVVRDPPERPAGIVPISASTSPAVGVPRDGRPDASRRTMIRRSAAVFGLVAAIIAGVVLLPGAANTGFRQHRPQAVGRYGLTSPPLSGRASQPARKRRRSRPTATVAAPRPARSGTGAASGLSPSAPPASASPSASASPPASASPSPAPAPTGRAAFGGAWNGTVSQPTWTVTSWTVELVIPAAGRQGSYSAPSLGCSGTLAVKSYTATTMLVRAKTTSGVNSGCVSKAKLTLALSGPAELSMTWVPVGHGHKMTGAATLVGG